MITINPTTVSIPNKQPSFRSRNTKLISVKKYPDCEIKTYEKEASGSKKFGSGVASFFVSGLGHVINGDWGKAAGFFFGTMATGLLYSAGVMKSISDLDKTLLESMKDPSKMNKSGSGKVGIAMIATSLVGLLGLKIWDVASAAKGARETVVHIIKFKENKSDTNI